ARCRRQRDPDRGAWTHPRCSGLDQAAFDLAMAKTARCLDYRAMPAAIPPKYLTPDAPRRQLTNPPGVFLSMIFFGKTGPHFALTRPSGSESCPDQASLKR